MKQLGGLLMLVIPTILGYFIIAAVMEVIVVLVGLISMKVGKCVVYVMLVNNKLF